MAIQIMKQQENEQPPGLHSEAVKAYGDQKVINALAHCDWFSTDFIERVQKNELEPERKGLGPFKDKPLGDFFMAINHLGKENQVYRGVRIYLYQRMVGSQGHPFSLKDIEFADPEVMHLAESIGTNELHEFDRSMIGEVDNMLQCLIAPEKIRNKVVKVTCRWGNEQVRKDVLLWAELVKRGAKAYIKSRDLQTKKI